MPSKTTRLESLLEAVPDALVGMDQEGVIRFVNRQTEALFGYDRDQLIGQHIDTLVPETLYAVYAQHREDYFADPRTRSSGLDLELNARMRDRTDLSVNISMSSIDTGDVLLVITARRDVIKQRRAVEDAQLTAAIVEFSADAIIGITLEGVVTSWNPAAEKMYGYSSEEILGTYAGRLSPRDRAGELKASLVRLKAGQPVEQLETLRVRRDGTVFPASITMAPIRDGIVGASMICRDVTEQRKAFEAAQRLAAIVTSSQDAITTWDLNGVITSWNAAAERIYGFSSEEAIGRDPEFISPEDRADEAGAILARIKVGQPVEHFETIRIRKDGTEVSVSLSVSPIRDAGGQVVGASTIARDITEQKRAFEGTQRLAAIVESSNDAIIGSTLEGVMTSWNPAAERMYGYSAAEVIGRSGKLLSPGNRIGEIKATLAKVRAGQHIEHLETIRVRKDGTTFPVSLTVSPILGEGGEVVGASAISRNMTELRHAARYTRGLIEAALDPLMTISPQGLINDVNEAAVKITGVPRDKLVGTDFVQYVTDPVKACESFRQAFTHGPVKDVPLTLRSADGTVTDALCSASAYRDHNGDVLGLLATAHDMTEQEHAAQYARSLIEAALDPLIMVGPDGGISDLNEAAVKIIGLSRDELIGSDFTQYVTEPDKAGEVLRRVLAQGWVINAPLTVRHRNGTLTRALCNASAYRDSTGNVLGMLAVARDVTEHLLKDEAVQQLASMVEFIDEAIIGTTLDGVVTSWNPAATSMHGYSADEVVGRSIGLVIPDDRADEVAAILARVNAGQVVRGLETVRLRKDGTVFPVSVTVAPIRDPGGAIVGSTAIGRELT